MKKLLIISAIAIVLGIATTSSAIQYDMNLYFGMIDSTDPNLPDDGVRLSCTVDVTRALVEENNIRYDVDDFEIITPWGEVISDGYFRVTRYDSYFYFGRYTLLNDEPRIYIPDGSAAEDYVLPGLIDEYAQGFEPDWQDISFAPYDLAELQRVQLQSVSAPVPEPTTMVLLGTGLVSLAGIARRRSKKLRIS